MSASPILITGGAQRLGRHCAERLVDDGHPVIISYRRERPELAALRERGIVTLAADFSTEAGILDFLARLKTETSSLRAIVHNASDWAPDSTGPEAGATFERLFRIHMLAPYLINLHARELLERCSEPQRDIVHMTDYVVQKGSKKHAAYAATKAGLVNLTRMMSLLGEVDRPELLYRSYTPGLPKNLQKGGSRFDAIAAGDILLHHPFQAFSPLVELVAEAARDPVVLAIKQTLCRTGADPPIADSLVEAARGGKEVTVVVELRARFDEAHNLALVSRLQEAGAIVIYGVMAYKTHAKMMHMVRREKGRLRHYAHLGTGNYHSRTARLYTDYSLLTANEALCEDVHQVFQQLSGMGRARHIETLLHAPFTLHEGMVAMIDREAEHARKGRRAHLIIKCNSLTEPKLIQALYRASRAGVECDLIIRGQCCLRPGVPGVSDNIRVRSIIGRFLEHTRVFHFHNNGRPEVWGSSADFMSRNMFHRVETCFPLLDRKLAARVRKDLETYLVDNCQSWLLQPDGSYVKQTPGDAAPISAQETLLYAYAAKT